MKKTLILVIVGALVMAAVGVASVSAQATTKSLSTVYTVQNLGNQTANIQVSYKKQYNGTTPGGDWTAAPANTTFTITAGTSKVIAQYLDPVLSDGAGSATVSADQPIAGIVNMLARNQTPTSGSYTAFSEGANSFFMPFVFKNLPTSVGIVNSQLIIMNVGTASTNVDVVMIDGVSGAPVYTKTISNLPPGESFYYDQSLETGLPAQWYGSAQVKAAAGGTVAAVGNQFTGADGLLTYPGFAAGYTEWIVPLYLSRLNNGYNSVIAIQNVSGHTIQAGGIKVVFTPDPSLGATPFTKTLAFDLANNGTWSVNPRNNPDFPVNSYGAARIIADADVVAIVNQLVNEPPNYSPSSLSYNAIPANLTGKKVEVPLIMSRLPNGYSTVLTIANLTNVAGTCNFYYKGDPGYGSSNVTVTGVSLPAGGSIVHNHRLASTTHNLPANWYGAATVECTQPVAGVVNQLQSGASGDPDLSYNAFTVD